MIIRLLTCTIASSPTVFLIKEMTRRQNNYRCKVLFLFILPLSWKVVDNLFHNVLLINSDIVERNDTISPDLILFNDCCHNGEETMEFTLLKLHDWAFSSLVNENDGWFKPNNTVDVKINIKRKTIYLIKKIKFERKLFHFIMLQFLCK